MDEQRRESLQVGTDEVAFTITSEPFVIFTYRGYVPAVLARLPDGSERVLFIAAASIAMPLEGLRKRNENRFSGIRIGIRKESTDRYAKYIVREIAE